MLSVSPILLSYFLIDDTAITTTKKQAMKFYITTLLLLSAFLLLETNQVFADDIVIYEPAANGLLYGDSPMDIRYRSM